MANIGRLIREIAAEFGGDPFTASWLTMRNIYVPRGTHLRQLHAEGFLVPAGSTWRLAPGVLARLQNDDQVSA